MSKVVAVVASSITSERFWLSRELVRGRMKAFPPNRKKKSVRMFMIAGTSNALKTVERIVCSIIPAFWCTAKNVPLSKTYLLGYHPYVFLRHLRERPY